MTALPLTAAQEGVWFAQALAPGSTAFVTAERLRLRGAVDPWRLAAAIRAAIDEADGLHVRFAERDGRPVQLPSPPGDWPLPVLDLRGEPDPHAAADRHTEAALRTPIDPARDRLFAQALLRVADDELLWLTRVHHLVVDAAGLALLAERAAEHYAAPAGGGAAGAAWFPPTAALLAAERAYATSAAAERDRAFWAARLGDRAGADASAPASLSDRPAGPVRGVHRASLALAPAWLDDVRALAGRAGASWPEAVIAAAGCYVARLTASAVADAPAPGVVLGVPLAARLGPVALRSPSTQVNVLPLPVTPAAGDRPEDVVRAVSVELRALRRHQRHRGEELRRTAGALGEGRALYGPLVNVLPFAHAPRFGDAIAEVETLAAGPVDDLSFNVYDRGGAGPRLDVEGHAARYAPDAVARHAERFLAFLERFAGAGAPPVADLELTTAAERALVVEGFNATAHPVKDTTLAALIADTARRAPDAVALRCDGTSMSYAELRARAAPLTARLAAAGAAPGRVVAVAVPRSFDLLVALVAILDSGAAYLPLDPGYPPGRLAMMLEDAQPVAVVAAPALEDLVAWPAGVPRLDPADPAPASATPIPPTPPAPGDPAYVLFTSGSTGRPKGVVVSHRAIVNRLAWMQDAFGLGDGDRVLHKTPVGFDVSVWELFWPLIAGVPMVIAPPEAHRDPVALAELIDAERVTTAHFVPSLLALFADAAAATRCPSLRRVICSGEALTADLRDRLAARCAAELHNLYGPTEAAVDVTHWACDAARDGAAVPIGRPLWNTRAYILDARRRPLPIGAAGELHLAGVQLADGYLGRPDLTAAAFVDDPFADGERMYKTGDLARWRPDGALEFLGRIDHQVKIRGQRIETGEVEAALLADPALAAAAVVAREDGPGGGARLVAYVVGRAGAPPVAERALRARLAQTLPDAMVPSAFVVLDALPLTPSGKLDRRALPAPAPAPSTGAPTASAPGTPREELIAAVFAERLGLPRLGATDDFFLHGGHSLLAAAAAAQLTAALGERVTIGAVFAAPTAAALARRLDHGGGDGGLDPLLRLRDGDGRPPLFCVHPAGGLGWCYANLARALEPGQAVFALQARALGDPAAPAPASIAALAREYADRVRAVQPDGPYRLLGWSVGGVIAHAMATALQDDGAAVELLMILDAYPGEQWRGLAAPSEAEALVGVLHLAGADPAALGPGPLTRARVVDALRAQGSALASLDDATLGAMLDTVARSARLMREHAHGRFAGDADLVVAAAPRPETWLDPSGWAAHVGGRLHVHHLDRTHPELVRPEASARIAALVTARLAGARARVADPAAAAEALA